MTDAKPFARHDLTEGPITRTLILFSLPVLGSNVLQSLNASVNAIWVGRFLGTAALTAISNANLVLLFLLGSVFGLGNAATILIAQAVGARERAQARRVFGTALAFFVVVSVTVAIIGYVFTPAILTAMHTPADAQPLAIAYLRIIFVALPFMYLLIFLMMAQRGTGDSLTSFLFMALSVGLDVLFNPLLIFGIGPFPEMGIAGSAAATLIAQAVSLLGMAIYLYRCEGPLCLQRRGGSLFQFDWTILRALINKGVPMGLQMVVISSSAIVMISLVNTYGSVTTAAFGVATQVWTYVQMPALAISIAVSSMTAQNIGAHRWDRVGRIARSGVIVNVLMTGVLVALIYTFEREVVGLFLPPEGPAIAIAMHIDYIVLWSFILFGITFVLFGVVRATGAVMVPLLILVVSMWLVRVPLAYYLAPRYGQDAIWWTFPLTTTLSVLMTIAYYRYGNWRSARMLELRPRSQAPDTGAGTPAVPMRVLGNEP
jgi:putative MATE family efflux protein